MSSYDRDRASAQARYLSRLGPDSLVALYLAPDPEYPNSAYKAFTRCVENSPLWRWDLGGHAVRHRGPLPQPHGVRIVRCSLIDLMRWEFDASRPALVALWKRSAEFGHELLTK